MASAKDKLRTRPLRAAGFLLLIFAGASGVGLAAPSKATLPATKVGKALEGDWIVVTHVDGQEIQGASRISSFLGGSSLVEDYSTEQPFHTHVVFRVLEDRSLHCWEFTSDDEQPMEYSGELNEKGFSIATKANRVRTLRLTELGFEVEESGSHGYSWKRDYRRKR